MKLKINGDIWDLTKIREQIEKATEDIDLYIDSPGGAALEGLQTAHCIANAKCNVKAHVRCLAASAAAIIALACDSVEIDKNSLLMLHNCWTISTGNKTQLRNDADGMEAIDKVMGNIISEHCEDTSILDEIEKGDLYLTGEEAAKRFNHVTLVDIPQKEGLAAFAPLVALVEENRELRKQVENAKKAYVVTDTLKDLLKQAEGV